MPQDQSSVRPTTGPDSLDVPTLEPSLVKCEDRKYTAAAPDGKRPCAHPTVCLYSRRERPSDQDLNEEALQR